MTDLPRIASFRQLDEHLKKTGVPRDEQMIRNNIYIAPLDWFAIEEGFNLRPIDPDHAEGFAKSYEQGLYVLSLSEGDSTKYQKSTARSFLTLESPQKTENKAR